MILQPVAVTNSSPVSSVIYLNGGLQAFKANGTWNGGTLTLTWCETSSGTFVPLGSGVALSANGSVEFSYVPGYIIATLSGSTSGATVQWGIDKVPV